MIFGALICVAVTAWAQFGLGYGDVGSAAKVQVDQWPLFWGGVAVVIAGDPAGDRTVDRPHPAEGGQRASRR